MTEGIAERTPNFARLIACRRDDAAGTSDRDGLSAQLRIVTLFDGRKQGIHVNVDDLKRALRVRFSIAVCPKAVSRSLLSQSWPGSGVND
jgi:hypothetical protein